MLGPGAVLFLSLFAGQAAVLVLAPILPDVAGEFGVSTATAGQLRSLSGVAGGLAAVGLGVLARRLRVRQLLAGGLALLAFGSLASASAPSFTALAAAQVAIGAGVAAVLSAGVAAAGEWARPQERTRVLSWALLGQPAAWVAGMPLVGIVAEFDWRLAWLVLPLASSALALVAVRVRRSAGETPEPDDRPLPSPWGEPGVGGRTIAATAFGLQAVTRHQVAVTSIRAAAIQFGYLLGAAIGGAALAAGGYAGMGAVLSALFALAIVPHLAAARGGLRNVPAAAPQVGS